MLSLRLLGRAAPKATLRPVSARCFSAISRPAFRPAYLSISKTHQSAFSTSIVRKEPAGESDQVLAAKFNHERELELESRDTSQVPDEIEDFSQKGPWEILDKPGTHEIILSRQFGNETIKVEFSITDMTDVNEEDDLDALGDEDGALADEEYEQPKKTINQSGVKGGPIDVAPEDSIAPADREGEFAEDFAASYPINLFITITKPGNQVVEVRAAAHEGAIQTENVHVLPTEGAEAEAEDETTAYTGPPFSNLDPDLQLMFEQYLEERGINSELAAMLPTMVEFKEQREYVGWLDNMKKFIEA